MALIGRKGSGKTRLLVDVLTSRTGLMGLFDKVIIVSPTFERQPIFRQRIDGEGVTVYTEGLTTENLNTIYNKMMDKPKAENTLIIFDDCADDVSRTDQKTMNKLVSNSRHLGVSLIFLQQKLTMLSTTVRVQTDIFVGFGATSAREVDALYHEIGIIPKKDFITLFRTYTQGDYSFFVSSIDRGGKITYNRNFRRPCAEETKEEEEEQQKK